MKLHLNLNLNKNNSENKNVNSNIQDKKLKNKKSDLFGNHYRNVFMLLFLWLSSLCVWLYRAYELEFHGLNNFLTLWYASVFFHFVNSLIIVCIILYFKVEKQGIRKKGK